MKVAYYSPHPPERSGIADYSALLLPALRRRFEVEIPLTVRRHSIAPHTTLRELRDLGRELQRDVQCATLLS